MTSPLDLAREMIELADKASPEPWVWHTSNSWRRLRGGPRDEHRVAEPVIQHPDNHPDILATDADKAFIARSRSIAPALAAAVVELTEALALMLTVEVQDPGHVHTLAQRARAQQLLGIGKEMPVQLWLTRFYKACAALAGKPQTQGEVG